MADRRDSLPVATPDAPSPRSKYHAEAGWSPLRAAVPTEHQLKFKYPGRAKKANLFDAHCHLDRVFGALYYAGSREVFYEPRFVDRYFKNESPLSILKRDSGACFDGKFEGCIHVNCQPSDWQADKWLWLTKAKDVWLTFGCHPRFARSFDESDVALLVTAIKNERTVAVGEIGLDEVWAGNEEGFKLQVKVFQRQLEIALEYKKPICLHIRGDRATRVAHTTLKKCKVPRDWPIHLHCFSRSWHVCQIWMKDFSGMKFGFAPDFFMADVAKNLPLDKILLETDAPYFPPSCLKGLKTGLPGHVWFSAVQIAYLKKVGHDVILEANRKNIADLYKIPVRDSDNTNGVPSATPKGPFMSEMEPKSDKNEENSETFKQKTEPLANSEAVDIETAMIPLPGESESTSELSEPITDPMTTSEDGSFGVGQGGDLVAKIPGKLDFDGLDNDNNVDNEDAGETGEIVVGTTKRFERSIEMTNEDGQELIFTCCGSFPIPAK